MDATKYMTALAYEVDLDIAQDTYKGENESYLTFNYEDEKPSLFADNEVLQDTAYLQIHLFTPSTMNYHSLKRTIRDYLESISFFVTSIMTFEEDDIDKKHTVFTVEYSEGR